MAGIRDKRVIAELDRISGRAAPLPWDPVVGVITMISPCLAFAVAFAMVAKLALVPSLATLAVGIVGGAALGLARERATAAVATQVEG